MAAIAYLGWGSLLWQGYFNSDAGTLWRGYHAADPVERQREEAFLRSHDSWSLDGPLLPLEFSRISVSRGGALTLVIDGTSGIWVQAAWCHAIAPAPDTDAAAYLQHAIDTLARREGLRNAERIGRWPDSGWTPSDAPLVERIASWATQKGLDGVVWTDLHSNFTERVSRLAERGDANVTADRVRLAAIAGQKFSVPNAIAYLGALSGASRRNALEYIQRAPDFVRTPLRDRLEQLALDRAL